MRRNVDLVHDAAGLAAPGCLRWARSPSRSRSCRQVAGRGAARPGHVAPLPLVHRPF